MRPKRIGISAEIRPSLDSRRSSIGSRRFLGDFQPPCAARGVALRSDLPAARRSSADMYAPGAPEASLGGPCFAFILRMPTLPSRPCVFWHDLDITPNTREIRVVLSQVRK